MKLLFLCKKIPYPPKDGEAIAILNILKGMHEMGHEVWVLAINTPKHHYEIAQMPPEIQEIAHFQTVFIDTSLSVKAAFLNLFTKQSYNIQRFYSPDFVEVLQVLLEQQQFDIIQLEGMYLASYIAHIRANAQHKQTPILMRAHNVEGEIWQRLAAESPWWNMPKKVYLSLLTHRMMHFEMEMLTTYDALVPISVKDEAYFQALGFTKPSLTIPASFDKKRLFPQHDNIQEQTLFFIGSMDWLPNLWGMQWFLKEVWTKLHNKYPNLKLYIAGRNMPEKFQAQKIPNVHIIGEVPDAIAYMRNHAIMIVPLFSGSGMRVKIIEALALGKPIVATTLAAEGIAYKDGQDLLVADNETAFVEKISHLIDNPQEFDEISQNAANFALDKHENKVLIQKLSDFYQTLLDTKEK